MRGAACGGRHCGGSLRRLGRRQLVSCARGLCANGCRLHWCPLDRRRSARWQRKFRHGKDQGERVEDLVLAKPSVLTLCASGNQLGWSYEEAVIPRPWFLLVVHLCLHIAEQECKLLLQAVFQLDEVWLPQLYHALQLMQEYPGD